MIHTLYTIQMNKHWSFNTSFMIKLFINNIKILTILNIWQSTQQNFLEIQKEIQSE